MTEPLEVRLQRILGKVDELIASRDTLEKELAAAIAAKEALGGELKVALDQLAKVAVDLQTVRTSHEDVWRWQGDGHDHPSSLVCPVVMSADTLRGIIAAKEAAEQRLDSEDWRDAHCPAELWRADIPVGCLPRGPGTGGCRNLGELFSSVRKLHEWWGEERSGRFAAERERDRLFTELTTARTKLSEWVDTSTSQAAELAEAKEEIARLEHNAREDEAHLRDMTQQRESWSKELSAAVARAEANDRLRRIALGTIEKMRPVVEAARNLFVDEEGAVKLQDALRALDASPAAEKPPEEQKT